MESPTNNVRVSLAQMKEELARREAKRQAATATAIRLAEQGDSDDDNEEENPVCQQYFNDGGNKSMQVATNFTFLELQSIWIAVSDEMGKVWNTGHGRRNTTSGMDMLFMLLYVLKMGQTWDQAALMFSIHSSTFERKIVSFMQALATHIYNKYVVNISKLHTMEKLEHNNQQFDNFPYAYYATDVRFQQCNRPSGNMAEGKAYFSGKHHMYGLKQEVSVLPIGLAVHASRHKRGSIADIDILYKCYNEHKDLLRKASNTDIHDPDNDNTNHPRYWPQLCDKGYQGADQVVRTIVPYKKPPKGQLTSAQQNHNKAVSHDRVIVENFFGRQTSLWGICANKYRWKHDYYDDLMKLTLALTNVHIQYHPLRAEDAQIFRLYMADLANMSEDIEKKRKAQNNAARAVRKARLHQQENGRNSDSENEE